MLPPFEMAADTRFVQKPLARDLKPSRFPESAQPMLCTLIDQPFDSVDWIFEPKLDGIRVLAKFDGERLTLLSRNGKPQEIVFPEIASELRSMLKSPAILDGEIVCLDPHGKSDFKSLQQRFHLTRAEEIEERRKTYPAYFYVFDILYFDRYDLTHLPLTRRKSILRAALEWNETIRWTPQIERGGTSFFKKTCDAEGEGIVAKRKEGKYLAERGADWVKIKCLKRQEFDIVGYTDPKGSREALGALVIGYHGNGKLLYAGKVGTGFTIPILRDLIDRLKPLETKRCPLSENPGLNDVHWVRPELIAEVAFSEWTQHGALRNPRYVGLREDKSPEDVVNEEPKQLQKQPSKGKSMSLKKYQSMRDFKKTEEPKGRVLKSMSSNPIFVIQEHHATRLHYDFRLEADGVLKSWAVTKEPTLDPRVRRLAVEVEDHPLDYAHFSGSIPEGEYGAGEVNIWDEGQYENLSGMSLSQAIEAGKLKFRLQGKKLEGEFALIRIKGQDSKPHWILIKARGKSELVDLTHGEKIMFPKLGATKSDIMDYYQRIAPKLLPYLKDRPVTVERLPEGVEGGVRFWQKNTPRYYPSWVPRVELPSGNGKPVQYALVNDLETLLYFVNQGALTFHVWASRVESLDRPDFALFDLDPGEASFKDVIRIATGLHEILDAQGISSYVKTSGKSGLHVMTPWTMEGDHDDAREWALQVAQELVKEFPKIATVERSLSKRQGRIYVDIMQNARGHHVVPPYVIRAVPEATVSTPLKWKELSPKLRPTQFDLESIFKRLIQLRDDPMKALLKAQERPAHTKKKRRAA